VCECNSVSEYEASGVRARMMAIDAERQQFPLDTGWAYAALMMEAFEHFGIDPMHSPRPVWDRKAAARGAQPDVNATATKQPSSYAAEFLRPADGLPPLAKRS
jgi:hypothetical protein